MADRRLDMFLTFAGYASIVCLGVAIVIAILARILRAPDFAPERQSAAPASTSTQRTRLDERATAISEKPLGECIVRKCSARATHQLAQVERYTTLRDWLIARLGGTAPKRYRVTLEDARSVCLGHADISASDCELWIASRASTKASGDAVDARDLHEHNAVTLYDGLCAHQEHALAKAAAVPKRAPVQLVPRAEGGETT